MDATSMVLRFRDLSTDQGETISLHKAIIENKGYVWWGWWKKQGETIPLEVFTAFSRSIKEHGALVIYLFDTGTLNLFRAQLDGIAWDQAVQFIWELSGLRTMSQDIDSPDIANVADNGGLTLCCPCCGSTRAISLETQEELFRELRAWDRRFERPETMVETLLEILGQAPVPARRQAGS
jgi:hypothetical protein